MVNTANWLRVWAALVFVLLFSSRSPAQVYEIRHFSEASRYLTIDAQTLVLYDFDNTLFNPGTSLGSEKWFETEVTRLREAGQSPQKAMDHANHRAMDILKHAPVSLVEPEIREVLQKHQSTAQGTLILTARNRNLAEDTFSHMDRVGVNFSTNSVWTETTILDGGFISRGVIFCDDRRPKGEVLLGFLARLPVKPKKILFIDDKMKHAKSVYDSISQTGIQIVALRYGAMDSQVNAFDSKLADFQMNHWRTTGVVLGDAEARNRFGGALACQNALSSDKPRAQLNK